MLCMLMHDKKINLQCENYLLFAHYLKIICIFVQSLNNWNTSTFLSCFKTVTKKYKFGTIVSYEGIVGLESHWPCVTVIVV